MKGGKWWLYTQNHGSPWKLELHELLTFKTACAFKAAMMQNQVQDEPAPGGLLSQDITNARTQIQELQDYCKAQCNKNENKEGMCIMNLNQNQTDRLLLLNC